MTSAFEETMRAYRKGRIKIISRPENEVQILNLSQSEYRLIEIDISENTEMTALAIIDPE